MICRRLGTFSAALTTLEKAGKAFLLWHARWSPIRNCWEATSPGSVLVSRPLSAWRTSTTTNVTVDAVIGYSASNPTLSKGGYGIFWKLVPLNNDTISMNKWSVADKLQQSSNIFPKLFPFTGSLEVARPMLWGLLWMWSFPRERAISRTRHGVVFQGVWKIQRNHIQPSDFLVDSSLRDDFGVWILRDPQVCSACFTLIGTGTGY